MQTERADLYFQQGTSDKVYHLKLENVQDQWSAQAQRGRRGSALQSDVKVSGTTYEEAKQAYDRILQEKTGKGYQIVKKTTDGNEAMAVGLFATKEHSGNTPELLTWALLFLFLPRRPSICGLNSLTPLVGPRSANGS